MMNRNDDDNKRGWIWYVITLPFIAAFHRRSLAKWMARTLLVCCLIQLDWIFPYLPFTPENAQSARSEDPQQRLQIVSMNVLGNDDAKSVLEIVRREQPDSQPVRVFAVHPNPSRPGESTAKRDAEKEQETRRQSTFLGSAKTP